LGRALARAYDAAAGCQRFCYGSDRMRLYWEVARRALPRQLMAGRYPLRDLTIEEPDSETIVRPIYEDGLQPVGVAP
jgi:hypothetical protein